MRAALLATIAAAGLAATAAAAPSRVVQGSSKIGSFATRRDHGELTHAVAAFGRPASLASHPAQYECVARWPALGLAMTFNGACLSSSCFIQAQITGTMWRTAKGLRVGDSLARLHALYPKARLRDGLEALLIEPALEGTIVSLGAKIADGKVVALRVNPCCPCEA